jgi:hypothetical protein
MKPIGGLGYLARRIYIYKVKPAIMQKINSLTYTYIYAGMFVNMRLYAYYRLCYGDSATHKRTEK